MGLASPAKKVVRELTTEARLEVAAWMETVSPTAPESVQTFFEIHKPYLMASGDPKKALEAAMRELRHLLHITPSSEKRSSSGAPLSKLPKLTLEEKCKRLERQIERGQKLRDWHARLRKKHNARRKRAEEKLRNMATSEDPKPKPREPIRVEDIELTGEDLAECAENAKIFVKDLQLGGVADPKLASVKETLMKGGGVVVEARQETLLVEVPEELADARVAKTLNETRVRYDFSLTVTRIELDVEKKVMVDQAGERSVIAASTLQYGPPRSSVTWEALATLAVLVGQFAIPFLATMLSTPEKTFTASALSRMLHYVAERLVPIYLELARQVANSEILMGDDTSCRVLEVSKHFKDSKTEDGKQPPWSHYRDQAAAKASFKATEDLRATRMRRRDEGDRTATPTKDENPSLSVLIARELGFEFQLKSGDGPKQALHVSVVSGRSIADDPRSLIIFYRSHLGSLGNLLNTILRYRAKKNTELILQTDMSTSNLVSDPEILKHLTITTITCLSHARRPFALHEDQDPESCEYMLHLMLGIFMHEDQLNEFGRNRENVLAVREHHSRELWEDILKLAQEISKTWSKSTNLGTAAHYIINHFEELTLYLKDPRLEATNNLSERMLRMEKLIEGSSMFRKSLEGRFVLDVVRTVLQTAVAAGASAHEYLVSVLRTSDEDVKASPEKFTPLAWAGKNRLQEPSEALIPNSPKESVADTVKV